MRQTHAEGTRGHRKGQSVSLQSPHRVHASCQHLCNVGLDVLKEQFVISQEAVEDSRVTVKVSFLSQVQVEVLSIFLSWGQTGGGKRVRLSVAGGKEGTLGEKWHSGTQTLCFLGCHFTEHILSSKSFLSVSLSNF